MNAYSEAERAGDNIFGELPVKTGAASEALAQREVSEVQGGMILAKRFPRDPVVAMDRIMQECARPTLAKVAAYEYARGGSDVSGPSIRLAEVLARNWGNIWCGVKEVARNDGASECVAYSWDLETGFRDEKMFRVRHWRDTKKGGYALTDERDIYERIADAGARRKRACILAVIPGDVVEAAVDQCELTLKTSVVITPDTTKKMLDKFDAIGVSKAMIEKRIQRRVEAITPALVVQLGKIYNSLKDGMSAPADWFEGGESLEERIAKKNGASGPAPGSDQDIARRAKAKKAAQEQQPPADDAADSGIASLHILEDLARERNVDPEKYDAAVAGIAKGPGTPEEKRELVRGWIDLNAPAAPQKPALSMT